MENNNKQFKLPKEFAIKWLEALRSGKFKQGTRNLFTGNGYCCVGVAGSICGIPDIQLFKKAWFDRYYFTKDVLHSFSIPEELKGSSDEYEITYDYFNPLLKELGYMNDGVDQEQKSFVKIADWIEENVEFY